MAETYESIQKERDALRARLAEVEAQRDGLRIVLLQGISLLENCDALTCMCGESVLKHNYQSDHPLTPMLEYYGGQWADAAREALAKLEEK